MRKLENISTHTPLAGRDVVWALPSGAVPISTHTPLAGRDILSIRAGHGPGQFLLTRPSRDVTISRAVYACLRKISTHTPLAGRDAVLFRS